MKLAIISSAVAAAGLTGRKAYKKIFPKTIVAKFAVDTQINRKSFQKLQKDIEKAYKSNDTIAAVAFVINSPGGSPVYSSLMGESIKSFAKENNVKLYTFAEDVAASGGYWLLCNADKVYAHPDSLVGSIGVISTLMALKGRLGKMNIEKRLIATSPELLEARLDPFQKEEIAEEDIVLV